MRKPPHHPPFKHRVNPYLDNPFWNSSINIYKYFLVMSKQPQDERRLAEGAFLALGIIFLILFLFYSCTPANDYPPVNDHHVKIVDETTYLLSSSKNVSRSFIPALNGDVYSYEIEGESVSITTDLEPVWVVYYTGVLDQEGRVLYRVGDYWTEENTTENGYFKFKY